MGRRPARVAESHINLRTYIERIAKTTQAEFALKLDISRTWLNAILQQRIVPAERLARHIEYITGKYVKADEWGDKCPTCGGPLRS